MNRSILSASSGRTQAMAIGLLPSSSMSGLLLALAPTASSTGPRRRSPTNRGVSGSREWRRSKPTPIPWAGPAVSRRRPSAVYCQTSHHTTNGMGHGVPNPDGVDQTGVKPRHLITTALFAATSALAQTPDPHARRKRVASADRVEASHGRQPPRQADRRNRQRDCHYRQGRRWREDRVA